MERTFIRMIRVEVTYSDEQHLRRAATTQWDEMDTFTPAEMVKAEQNRVLSDWFYTTEYTVLDDEMSEVTP